MHQLTCSPVHNKMDWYIRPGFRLSWSRAMKAFGEAWAEQAGAPPKPLSWQRIAGPLFGNTIATLDIDGDRAHVFFEQPLTAATLAERARVELTS